ncbi:MAG: hypothetical protein KatS3mg091_531 [Patescibacteria group bacterium]|nr:MAG: hypothetical protein KatS3mg090_0892 [Patescibacteria group bacterium]GIW63729.1 MAG: hypothetical protein KatS3mg091_531 [Patescibacteria group bacterium]
MFNKNKSNKYVVILIFLFITLGLIIRLIKFRQQPFYDWDEALYGQVAREMLVNKTLNTTFNSNPWLDKPPLSYLMISVVFSIFNENEAVARSLFAIFAIALLFLIYLLTKKIIRAFYKKSDDINLIIIPILITSASKLFIDKATTLNTDIIISVSILGYFAFYKNKLIKTLFLILGVWTKSVIGFFPLIIEPFLIIKSSKNMRSFINKTLFLLFQLGIACLWYFYAYLQYGDYFIKAHFYSQIYKRIILPIELHFGDKWFYFKVLGIDLSWLILAIILGLMILIKNLVLDLYKNRVLILKSDRFILYIVLLSPLLLLFIYTIVKTKLDWYLIYIIPIISIYPIFLLSNLKSYIRKIAIFLIIGYSIFKFSTNTYVVKPQINIDEKIILAKCLNQKNIDKLSFLADEEQRTIKNVLEAAKLQTESSFLYSGSPSFVFYLNKPIQTYYSTQEFVKNYKNSSSFVISKQDYENLLNSLDTDSFQTICQTENWIGFKKIYYK